MDADKELERILNDRLKGNVEVTKWKTAARGACLLFSRGILLSGINILF